MKNLLNMLVATLRAKIMRIWAKVRLWTSPAFLKNKVLAQVRIFFAHLLDVRPKDQKDYYPVFRWLVSKRLAFALVVLVGIVSVLYISSVLPAGFFFGKTGIPTYNYRSLALKFYSGEVRITARQGYVAYDGQVSGGAANGRGCLYNAAGTPVYEGEFAENRYSGQGTLYYDNGVTQYTGAFSDNLFHGTGSYYRPNGVLEYSGEYVFGERMGKGTLYDTVGKAVYTGNFAANAIVYQDFLQRPVSDIAAMYTGQSIVYRSENENCAYLPDINAVYAVQDGADTLENEWSVQRIYVLSNTAALSNGKAENLREVTQALGEPVYYGSVWVNLPEAVAANVLSEQENASVSPVQMETESAFETVFDVAGYDKNAQLYLYSFRQEDLVYHFYFTEAGESEFIMYAIEKAA